MIVGGEEGGSWSGGMNRQLRAQALSPFARQRLAMFVAKQRSSDLESILGFIEAGTVTPGLDRTFPLDAAPEAMRYLEAGKARGGSPSR